jgi:amino acid transporter
VGGTLKLSFLATIVVVMIVTIQTAENPELGKSLSHYNYEHLHFDKDVAHSWTHAFLMSLTIAAFAFVGVEITAASALEARVTKEKNPTQPKTIGRTIKFSAVYISFLAGVIYVLAGILITLNIKWDDKRLSRTNLTPTPESCATSDTGGDCFKPTTSAFVLAAELSNIPGLASTLNAFLMFTALSSANTDLYVASRTLFSLTRSLDGGPGQPWYTRFLAYSGKTNSRKVPLRALVASCIFF